MMEPVAQLLRRQLQDGLPDLDGAEAAATIPISDRLLSQAIVAGIPSGAPVKDVLKHFGFTTDNVVAAAKKQVEK